MAVAIPIIVILVGRRRHDDRARGEPLTRRHRLALARDARPRRGRPARPPGVETSSSHRARDHRTRTRRRHPRHLRERARQARAAATSPCGSRSTRKSSASPAGSSSTAALVGDGRLLSVASFGAACLGFLWPTGSSGFGGKIAAGKISDIIAAIQAQVGAVLRSRGARLRACSTRPPTSRPRRRSTAPSPTPAWNRDSSRCTSAACTSAAACRGARPRSGSSARATARSTTGSARRRPVRPPRPRPLRHPRRRRQLDHQHRRHRDRSADRDQHDRTAAGRPALRLISTHRREPEAMAAAWSVS